MKREDDQELWDLLGRSAEPKASPFFARNVLREIRQPASRWEALGEWFHLPRLAPAVTGVALALIATFFLRTQTPVTPKGNQMDPVAVVEAEDNEVIADLDDLLDPDDSWDEESAIL